MTDIQETETGSRALLGPEHISTFVFAGDSRFTLQSKRTGAHYTYKVREAKDESRFFVSVLRGENNDTDYSYIGMVMAGRRDRLIHTRGSKVGKDAPSFVALAWFLAHHTSPQVECYHEGRCGRCGRSLTVPESIQTGLGPVCSGKL